VYRDQGNGKGGDGKEVCDLIVVFGDNIVLFSDKSCAFPVTGTLDDNWRRWFKKAVLKSAQQVWGAERWIRNHPDRLFLDRKCTQKFPIAIAPLNRIQIHRIVVARNVSKPCRQHFGGSGSLIFNSEIEGSAHLDQDHVLYQPFATGWLDRKKGFVHVLDDTSLEILLENRDTIQDFLDYLQAKEALFLRKGVRFFITGEEELLARYLTNFEGDKHSFCVPSDVDTVFIPEGHWLDFLASEQRKAQISGDRLSYSWDMLIEKFNEHILGGTSYYASHFAISDRERIMRFMARESRLRRRMLAEAIHGLIAKTKPNQRSTRVVLPSSAGDPHYIFLLFPEREDKSHEEYRLVRRRVLEAYCMVMKLVYPNAVDILGIATESGFTEEDRSEDALYLNAREWSSELDNEAKRLQDELGLLTNLTMSHGTFREYPIRLRPFEARSMAGKNPRNKPCPCGSGLKFKRCYGG
jgi:hypothetical protein